MLIRSIKQILGLVTLGFAVLGFVHVPIFGASGLDHAKTFLASEEATEIKEELEAWRDERPRDDDGEVPEVSPNEEQPLHRRKERQQRLAP
jgi:hypothetical protein